MPCTIAVYEKSDGKTYVSLMNMDMLGMIYGGLIAEIAGEFAPQMMETGSSAISRLYTGA
jgi:uncharacterized protein (DUF302 family)